ncbi:MAG TPA: hypothetical protein VFQ79_24500, partial [Bryobacteraceae bacterium]|nr:hypothetical protein [Bryobacteraceae bacterium]
PAGAGNVYAEPAAVNFQSNDRYPQMVFAFLDTSTRDGLGGRFAVPKNYAGSPKIVVDWSTTATAGNAVWDFDYTAVGGDAAESYDPSADQQSVTVTDAASATARRRQSCEMSLTASNLAPDDTVQFTLFRDGAGGDTIAATLYLFGLYFEFSDV